MGATTTPSSSSPSGTSSSTSRPIDVSVAANSSRVASVVTCWRSQFSLNFILKFRDWGLGIGDSEERDAGVYESRIPNPEYRPSGKLPEEPHVVVAEAAQVDDAVAQHSSKERRVGKEGVNTFRTGLWPYI